MCKHSYHTQHQTVKRSCKPNLFTEIWFPSFTYSLSCWRWELWWLIPFFFGYSHISSAELDRVVYFTHGDWNLSAMFRNMLKKAHTDQISKEYTCKNGVSVPHKPISDCTNFSHACRNQIVFLLCDRTESAAKSNYFRRIIVVTWIPIQTLFLALPLSLHWCVRLKRFHPVEQDYSPWWVFTGCT